MNTVSNIPTGWYCIAIGDCIIERKKSIVKVEDATNYGPYPFFTSGDNVLRHTSKFVDGENIFLASGGMFNVKYYYGDAAYSTDTYVICGNEKCDTKFLYYILLFLKDYININYFQGSGLKHLQKRDFKRHELIMPKSLDEQKRIAAALSKMDDAIMQSDSLIQKYELIKIGLIQDLLTYGIDTSGNIRSEKTHRFKNSPIGRIPEEWDVVNFKNLAGKVKDYIKTGPFGSTLKGEHWREQGVPVITIGSLGEDSFIEENLLFIDENKAAELSAYSLKEGDILFSRVADVGRSLIIDQKHSGWIMSSNFMRLRIDISKLNPYIINWIIKYSNDFRKQIHRNVNSSGRSVTNTKILNSFIVPYMDGDEQNRIIVTVNSLLQSISCMIDGRISLNSQKKGLLSDLIEGKVRI